MPRKLITAVKHPVAAAIATFGAISAGGDLIFGLLAETSGAWFGLAGALAGLGRNLAAVPEHLATQVFVTALAVYAAIKLVRLVNSSSDYIDRNT